MLLRVLSWLRHHSRSPRILNGFSFRWYRRTIDAEGARRDDIQGRDVLETLGPLHWLIHDSDLLRKPLHLLCGERLAGTCSGHRVAMDGAVGRV